MKAFVEFFLPTADWERLRRKLSDLDDVTYYAGNADGEFMCSDARAVNVVTWGVFPGKE
jgi:methylenetetrahydrofolate reductase (NADPH)